MRTRAFLMWTIITGASLGIHVAAFGGLGRSAGSAAGSRARRPASMVEMEVSRAKVPPPAPEAPKPAPKAAPRLAAAHPARVTAAKPAAPPSVAPPPAAETPADFTGMTLTSDGAGPGWASATGNGEAMHGPVGKPGARVTGRRIDGAAPPPPKKETPLVGIADLSRAPEAPDLGAALERFYPVEARRKGVGGKAVVHARVMPDGRVRELALVSETEAGFGAACRQTLAESRWSAPLDRDGNPVSTFINYTCRFEVR